MSNTNANNNTPNNSNNNTSLPPGNKKKKVIAVTSGIIIAMLVIIAIVGITRHSSSKYEKADDSMVNTGGIAEESTNEFDETTESTTETTTQDLIEESGAIEICSGSDAEGNEYKLVCTQEESYDKVTVKVGVIKNNQWLQKLSSKSPFLNEDGSNLLGLSSSPRKESEERNAFDEYQYVADGVFALMPYFYHNYYLFYNADNNKTSSVDYASWTELFTANIDSNGHYIVYSKNNDDNETNNIIAIDTNTMKEKVIIKNTKLKVTGAFNDGLFPLGTDHSIDYFYDINGKKVIDIKNNYDYGVYYVDDASNNCYNFYGSTDDWYKGVMAPYFRNGTFEFNVKNSAGTWYNMIIDKSGKLIKNEEFIL